jgi:hypothetical protein
MKRVSVVLAAAVFLALTAVPATAGPRRKTPATTSCIDGNNNGICEPSDARPTACGVKAATM